MEKIYIIKNLDCGSCAQKIERAVNKLDGVDSAQMNFMTEKLTIKADEQRIETLLPDIQKAVKRIERSAVVS